MLLKFAVGALRGVMRPCIKFELNLLCFRSGTQGRNSRKIHFAEKSCFQVGFEPAGEKLVAVPEEGLQGLILAAARVRKRRKQWGASVWLLVALQTADAP